MFEKDAGARFPAHGQGEFAAVLARTFERGKAGAREVIIQRADRGFADHVARRGRRKAATGTPLASASNSTRPKVSVRLGNTKTSAAA